MNVLGIDPGQSGGIAYLSDGDQWCIPMPVAGKEIDGQRIARMIQCNTGSAHDSHHAVTLAIVEWAQAMPKQGVTGMFKYGMGFGKVLGVLEALSVPYKLVRPQAWKKVVLAGTAKDKDAAVAYVRRAHPWLDLTPGRKTKPHDGMADALCLAEYARHRIHYGREQA